MKTNQKRAIIIGAGPAGLTAALELLRRTDIKPIVLEASEEIGGISRTIRYKGNRMDIGGHRFFSKSDRVMNWWMELMPIGEDAASDASAAAINYQGSRRSIERGEFYKQSAVSSSSASHSEASLAETSIGLMDGSLEGITANSDPELVMLIRPRKSRIYYLRRFFDYPISLTASTLRNLGVTRVMRVGTSYMLSQIHQIKTEKSLEDFLINRFGRELYLTFFKSYTEKVWGTPCNQISSEWGAQRIKGLSLSTAVKHFARKILSKRKKGSAITDISQKQTDTSLIERFMYPKLGPGQLWEHVADEVVRMGGEIRMDLKVDAIETLQCDTKRFVQAIEATNSSGQSQRFQGDLFFSTMPMRELVEALSGECEVPANVREVAAGLQYRDFITVGLLCDRLKVRERDGGLLKDTWIYIQEPDVLLGRLQIFNNWSPYLLSDPTKVWMGLEYFCNDTDVLWTMSDDDIKSFAIMELAKIGIIDADTVNDGHVVRVPKTYPAYFGTYSRFDELREWTDSLENLFLIGRNGMHKYNNQDHSMLTAMTVVDGLVGGHVDKAALWNINTEQEYHEAKK